MKRTLFTLLLSGTFGLMAVGLFSCRKDKNEPTLKQYDQQQIEAYMSANGLTSVMKRDTSGGDTTGIYYQILNKGTGKVLDYPDMISYVFTIKSLDGSYVLADTIANHGYSYVGHMIPQGVMLAVKNILKTNGTSARLLIPSHLAYGTSGIGTGTSRLKGNQSLDYYINVVQNQAAYDDLVIQNFLKANGLTSYYTRTSSGLYYRILQAGTGTQHPDSYSTLGVQYTGKLLNQSIFDGFNPAVGDTTYTSFDIGDLVPGVQEGLQKVTKGAKISMIMPSALAYGNKSLPAGTDGVTVPPNSCLIFDFNLMAVTN
jgi:FKBP-type peptidyl-prolyl cis-trans isomerase